jgi:hypothetical protein
MIKTVRKLLADTKTTYRVNLRYQRQTKWYPCKMFDADSVGIAVEVDNETIAVPWSGIAALSFAEVKR